MVLLLPPLPLLLLRSTVMGVRKVEMRVILGAQKRGMDTRSRRRQRRERANVVPLCKDPIYIPHRPVYDTPLSGHLQERHGKVVGGYGVLDMTWFPRRDTENDACLGERERRIKEAEFPKNVP